MACFFFYSTVPLFLFTGGRLAYMFPLCLSVCAGVLTTWSFIFPDRSGIEYDDLKAGLKFSGA